MALDSSVDELTSVVVRVRGLLLPEHDAQAAVSKLAQAANHLIESAVGAGVSLLDDQGRRLSNASTDTVTEAADAVQYRLGEGPCLTAWAKQEAQQVDDTLADPRWPRWSAAAAEMGIRSVLSIPLSYGGRSTGAIKVLATGVLMARRDVDAAAARALLVAQARARVARWSRLPLTCCMRANRARVRPVDEGDDALCYEQARRLRAALTAAGIARGEFWLYYFGLGGNVGEFEVDAYLNHSLMLTAPDRDLLAQAANELLDETPRHRAPYASDLRHEQNAAHGREERDGPDGTLNSEAMGHDESEESDGRER